MIEGGASDAILCLEDGQCHICVQCIRVHLCVSSTHIHVHVSLQEVWHEQYMYVHV